MTGNRQYASGANLERAAVAMLRARGWPLVIRSAGSHGPVDVIALGGEDLPDLIVQAKADGYVGPQARQELLDLAGIVGAIPCVADRGGPRRTVRFQVLIDHTHRTPL